MQITNMWLILSSLNNRGAHQLCVHLRPNARPCSTDPFLLLYFSVISWHLSTELVPNLYKLLSHYSALLKHSPLSNWLALQAPGGAPGWALTTACNPRRSCSNTWGPCSCARCHRRISESRARSLPSSSASRWLCQPTRCKGFHLGERERHTQVGTGLVTTKSCLWPLFQRQCGSQTDQTKCTSIVGLFNQKYHSEW